MDEASHTVKDELRDGFGDTVPVLVAIIPFGALFGALAAESGMSVAATVAMSAGIYAGASQYLMLDLIGQSAPAWSIILAVFVLNFRHVLYSAALGRHMDAFRPTGRYFAFFFLADPLYALSEKRRRVRWLRPAYYMTSALALYCIWIAATFLGALFGGLIENPATYGLDFILPLFFVSLTMAFRKSSNFLPTVLTSGVASLAAWATLGGTWPIMIGGAVGLVVAAVLAKPENRQDKGEAS
jgi:4-azaleucine resistance transporter AzlC